MIIQQKKYLHKPEWLKHKIPIDFSQINKIKAKVHKNNLNTVCQAAACPNLVHCFNRGIATFMILGSICTRRCPFCDIDNGRPYIPDINEPSRLAQTIEDMELNYVVITSVTRDDLHDGGAQQFANCINAIHKKNLSIKIEILVPDFRGCMNQALKIFNFTPPDVFNHNIENVPRIYHKVRPGANYSLSLELLQSFKKLHPLVPTKSGLMMGLGETNDEVIEVMYDLHKSGVSMLTLGQYLQPSSNHLPVERYVTPSEFNSMKNKALSIGFSHVACGPLVRSSYYADMQFMGFEVK
ncbi:lipoyl synthase [Pantoea sp. Mhis]|uniref:lipoyl synthase n=1 Tax=Pantoea sp. Mhis TaxID=2576759 RepID=UPI001357DA3A|nr:lipoyl synthase [Pantoea sp. Mhis]